MKTEYYFKIFLAGSCSSKEMLNVYMLRNHAAKIHQQLGLVAQGYKVPYIHELFFPVNQ
jgi:hypothetical protein